MEKSCVNQEDELALSNRIESKDSDRKSEASIFFDERINIKSSGDTDKYIINPSIFNVDKINAAISSEQIILITDKDGFILYLNQNCSASVGYQPEELIGKHTRIFKTGIHSREFYRELWDTLLCGKIWKGEMTARRKDGSTVWNFLTIFPLLDENQQPYQFLSLRTDITEKKMMELHVEQKERQLSAIIQNSHDMIGTFDQNGMITFLNPAFERNLGFTIQESLGTSIFDYIGLENIEGSKNILDDLMKTPEKSIRMEIKIKSNKGTIIWCEALFTNYLNDSLINGLIFSFRDITEQKVSAEKIKHMAYFDFLTELPNRRCFEYRLKQELISAKRNNSLFALMIVDIDEFKYVNDTFGHGVGDQLLKEFSSQINSAFSEDLFFGRLGGDEFVFLLPAIKDIEDVNKHLSKLASLIKNKPFNIQGNELFITASIGVSIYPISGENEELLFKNADISLYHAKNNGKNQYQFFSSEMILPSKSIQHAKIVN